MNKSILIVGGSGILSSSVVDECIFRGYDVTLINRGNNVDFINKSATLIKCDARNKQLVLDKICGMFFDVVIDFIVYNIEQLKLSLELFGNKTRQYVFISSAQVYNTSLDRFFVETDETPQYKWDYSVNKYKCESFLKKYCSKYGINYTIVRPGVNYDNRRIPYGMCPSTGMHWTIVSRLKNGKPIITWNNGNNKLNLTHVSDFSAAFVELLDIEKSYGQTFNIVGDYTYSWLEVLELVCELTSTDLKTFNIDVDTYANELCDADRQMLLGGRSNNLICSNKKLKSVIPGFETKIPLRQGLRQTLEWYQKNSMSVLDYKWDAEQDRIISRYSKSNIKSIGFCNYNGSKGLEYVRNLCIYKIEFYKYNIIMNLFWRMIRKLIYKPLIRMCL